MRNFKTQFPCNATNETTIEGDFVPEYDSDGNATKIRTATGTWQIAYNAENRPIRFENAGTQTVVEMNYDAQGRRFEKKVTVAGTTTLHHRYIYRGFLQIAALNLQSTNLVAAHYILWDPTQSTATRPLAIQTAGTWFVYGHDLTKNVMELFGPNGFIRNEYSYAPFGAVSSTTDLAQPFQFSSEFYDFELALVYYNYRHYSPDLGRFLSRDPIEELGGLNLYCFVKNNSIKNIDILGLYIVLCFAACEKTITVKDTSDDNIIGTIENVFSGNGEGTNNPEMQHISNIGMLPLGEYWIGNPRNKKEGHFTNGDFEWYPLYGDNGKGGKSFNKIPVKDSNGKMFGTRGGFYIHTGRESNGCVTIWSEIPAGMPNYPQSSDFDWLKKVLDEGEAYKHPRKNNDTYRGILVVVKCEKDCEEEFLKYK